MTTFFIEAEDESGEERIAEFVEALTFEDAAEALRNRARVMWPTTLWRPLIVADAAVQPREDFAVFARARLLKFARNAQAFGGVSMQRQWEDCAKLIGVLSEIYAAKGAGENACLSDASRRAVRAIFAALDVKLAAELKDDVLHAGTALATLMMIRDTVQALDPELGELDFPQAHAAASSREKPGGIRLCPECGRMLDRYGDCNHSDVKEDF